MSCLQQLFIFTGLQNVDWVSTREWPLCSVNLCDERVSGSFQLSSRSVVQIPIHDPEVPVFDIIQPVLQYPADGGDWYSVKSWSVSFIPCCHF